MKQIAMREFQLNANKYLSQLPIELTKYGRVVALIQSPDGDKISKKISESISEKKLETFEALKSDPEIKPTIKKGTFKWNGIVNVCSHGFVSGRCPEGCK
jgi:hypothetical protein